MMVHGGGGEKHQSSRLMIICVLVCSFYVVVVVLLRRRFEGFKGKRSIEATTSKLEHNLLIPLFVLGQELDMVNYLPASKSQPPASIDYEWLHAL